MLPPSNRNAFTLVELLVVIALMAVLSGMMTFALSGARQDARVRRAEAEITAITTILQHKMNEINMQAVSYQPAYEVGGPTASGVVVAQGTEQNRVAMLARRDLMRMTLPQCRADLIYPPARLQYRKAVRVGGTAAARACAVKIKQPPEWTTMRRIAGFINPNATAPGIDLSSPFDPLLAPYGYFSNATTRTMLGRIRRVADGALSTIDLTAEPWGPDLSADANTPWTREYESAECLYLILASTEMFGERALDQFNARSIANLDEDNVPEIVDPWGRPYEFIRDATGYGFPFLGLSVAYSIDTGNDPPTGHPSGADANDYLRTDFRYDTTSPLDDPLNNPYRITPLVISSGIDDEFGIRRSFNPRGSVANGTAGISPRQSIAAIRLNPVNIVPRITSAAFGDSYQYPDPFAFVGDLDPNFEVNASDTGSDGLGGRTIRAWFRGQGLGAPLLDNSGRIVESSTDNIYSSGPVR